MTTHKTFPTVALMPSQARVRLAGSERRSESAPDTWYIFEVSPPLALSSGSESGDSSISKISNAQIASPSPSYLENYDEQMSQRVRSKPYKVARTFQHFCTLYKCFEDIFNKESIQLPNFPKAFRAKSCLYKWQGARSPTRQQQAIRDFLCILDTQLGSGTLWQCLWVAEFFGPWRDDNNSSQTPILRLNVPRPYHIPSLRYSKSCSLLGFYGFQDSLGSGTTSPTQNLSLNSTTSSMFPMCTTATLSPQPQAPQLDPTLTHNSLRQSTENESLPLATEKEKDGSKNGLNVVHAMPHSAHPDRPSTFRAQSWLFINGQYFNLKKMSQKEYPVERIPTLAEDPAKPIKYTLSNSNYELPADFDNAPANPSDTKEIMNQSFSLSQTNKEYTPKPKGLSAPVVFEPNAPVNDEMPSIVAKDQLAQVYQECIAKMYGPDAVIAGGISGAMPSKNTLKKSRSQWLPRFGKSGSSNHPSDSSTAGSVSDGSTSTSARSSMERRNSGNSSTGSTTAVAATFGNKLRRCLNFKDGRHDLNPNTEPRSDSDFEFIDMASLDQDSTSAIPKPSFNTDPSPASSAEILPVVARNLSIRRNLSHQPEDQQQTSATSRYNQPASIWASHKKAKSVSFMPLSPIKTHIPCTPGPATAKGPTAMHSPLVTPSPELFKGSKFPISLTLEKLTGNAGNSSENPKKDATLQAFVPYLMDIGQPKAKELRMSRSSINFRKKVRMIGSRTAPDIHPPFPSIPLPLYPISSSTKSQGDETTKTSSSYFKSNHSLSNLPAQSPRKSRQAKSMQNLSRLTTRDLLPSFYPSPPQTASLSPQLPKDASWVVTGRSQNSSPTSRSPMLKTSASSSSPSSNSVGTHPQPTMRYVHYFVSNPFRQQPLTDPCLIHVKLILKPENTIVALPLPQSLSFSEVRRRILIKLMNSGMPATQLKKRVLSYYTRSVTLETIESDNDWSHLLKWVAQVMQDGNNSKPSFRRKQRERELLAIPDLTSDVLSSSSEPSDDDESPEMEPCEPDQWVTVVKATLFLMPRSHTKAFRRPLPPPLSASSTIPPYFQNKPIVTL